jgi:hypothetical protein
MSDQPANQSPSFPARLLRQDVAVAVVVVVALALGWLLRLQVENRSRAFQDANSPFRLSYPAGWIAAESLQDVLLKVEDPQTASALKTSLTVEGRDLDPSSPPTLQTLVDRRVTQKRALTAYRFLSDAETTVDGARGAVLDYAYVVQPIDAPRRASLPVVARAREYIVVGKDRTYYITLAAPEAEFDDARARLDQIIQTVKLQ